MTASFADQAAEDWTSSDANTLADRALVGHRANRAGSETTFADTTYQNNSTYYQNHCPAMAAMLQWDLEVSTSPTYDPNLLVYLSVVILCTIPKYMEHQLALLIQSFFAA